MIMKGMNMESLSPLPHHIIDTHAHLVDEAFDEIRGEVLQRAGKGGIAGVVLPGDTLESSRAAVALAGTDPRFFRAAVGLHPYDAKYYSDDVEKELKNLAADSVVTAIGEIGLDVRRDGSDPSPRDVQVDAFLRQMALARSLQLPVIIHCRNAYEDLLSLLRKEKQPDPAGVVHCFSGTRQQALSLVELGYHIGFTGNLTFKNAPDLREAAGALPLEKILIETDCPYLTPHPWRGHFPNEPVYVRQVALTLASSTGRPLEEVCRITTQTARRLFFERERHSRQFSPA